MKTKPTWIDINNIKFDYSANPIQRAKQYFDRVDDPYFFTYKDITVEIAYNGTASFDLCLSDALSTENIAHSN